MLNLLRTTLRLRAVRPHTAAESHSLCRIDCSMWQHQTQQPRYGGALVFGANALVACFAFRATIPRMFVTHYDFGRILAVFFRFGIYFVLGWGALWWGRWRRKSLTAKSQSWGSVDGGVVSVTVAPIPKTTKYKATVTYNYFVGEYRAGEYVVEFSRESDADSFAADVRPRRLQIRFNPNSPDSSCIDSENLRQLTAVLN